MPAHVFVFHSPQHGESPTMDGPLDRSYTMAPQIRRRLVDAVCEDDVEVILGSPSSRNEPRPTVARGAP